MEDDAPRGLDLAFAGLAGAVLGLVAICVGATIAEVSPGVGIVYFLLLLAVVLSAVVRLIGALFAPSLRRSIKARPVAHAIWFGAALGMVLIALMAPRLHTSFLADNRPTKRLHPTAARAFRSTAWESLNIVSALYPPPRQR
jgi:hypothetical protein